MIKDRITLIEKGNPKYMRRMVREVRDVFQRGHGVYYGSHRITNIRFLRFNTLLQIKFDGDKRWAIAADIDGFYDGYARQICSSRAK